MASELDGFAIIDGVFVADTVFLLLTTFVSGAVRPVDVNGFAEALQFLPMCH